MKKVNFLILCALIISLSLLSCTKSDNSNTKSTYSVKMTDAPGPYNAVYIDLVGVEITGTNNSAVLLNTNNRIYNLLNFANGKDTLIGMGTLDAGTVEQVRLILGPNSTVIVNHVSYPLSTPSAEQTGLKLQVHQTLVGGVAYSILLDFDANQSIVDMGNGTYKLKPVVRTIDAAISGTIKGKIAPLGTLVVVTATSGLVSFSANVSATGDFLFMGLPAGTYTVIATPVLPKVAIVKTSVVVTTGVATDAGTFTIL